MSDNLISTLNDIKKQIEDSIIEKSRLEGQRQVHEHKLNDLGYPNSEEAKKDIHKLEKEIQDRREKLNKEITELLKNYENIL